MKNAAFASAYAVTALLVASPAFASPTADKAKARIHPIAKGNIGAIMAAYATTVPFHWFGGPLDGTHESC